MGDSQVLIAFLTILGTVVGIVVTVVTVMVWLVKRSDKRQDSTIDRNTEALDKNNDAYLALAQSINDSAAASRSLEESIRKRDEQDRKFQEHVLSGFKKQGRLLQGLSDKSDRMLHVLDPSEDNKS